MKEFFEWLLWFFTSQRFPILLTYIFLGFFSTPIILLQEAESIDLLQVFSRGNSCLTELVPVGNLTFVNCFYLCKREVIDIGIFWVDDEDDSVTCDRVFDQP